MPYLDGGALQANVFWPRRPVIEERKEGIKTMSPDQRLSLLEAILYAVVLICSPVGVCLYFNSRKSSNEED